MISEFKLISLDSKKIVENSIVRVEYMIESDHDESYLLNIEASDIFFNLKRECDNQIRSNIIYFTEFNFFNDVPGISDGFNIIIKNKNTSEILFSTKYIKPNKTIWIFGDSHALHIKNEKIDEICENNGYKINCIGAHSLSLNRFVNGDFINYLRKYDIKKQDYILLYLGEIDFRFTIHKHCQNKNLNLYHECYGLMMDYLTTINKITEEYSNEIIVLSPNPPMRDLSLEELILGNENDRKLCWDIFDRFWKKSEIKYFDWTDEYKLSDGMINPDLLIENDHHINNYKMFIEKLIKWF
jgi:hypothetical protein